MIGAYTAADGTQDWAGLAGHLYRYIVRPIAVGGMLVGACFTLFRMRKNLIAGIKRGVADVQEVGGGRRGDRTAPSRTCRSRSSASASRSSSCSWSALYFYFTGVLARRVPRRRSSCSSRASSSRPSRATSSA